MRSTDKGRKSSAFAAALYLAKYDDMANENRFINGMVRAGHSYEPIRGETVTFLYLGVSKPTYDHLITYTLRNRRVAASFRANVPWGYAVPHEAKNKQKYRIAMKTMLNYAEATHEEGEQLQAVRSMYPAGVLLPPFMFDFSEEALVKNVFTQRVWRRGVQGETAEICRDMLECMKLIDPVKWATLEEYHGAHIEAQGKVMRNLRDWRFKKMKPTDFSYYLSIFLTSYLAGLRNLSSNTIKSYRDTFVLLLEFIKDNHSVSPEKVTIKYVEKIIIEEFLGWLESSRNNSISTRNQRLAGIHAFFRYLQGEKPEYLFHCQKILAIPVKRSPKPVIGYLSEGAMETILKMPDTSTSWGRRDLTLLSTLYDTGARAQELADITLRNVRLDIPAIISLTGKGNKTRHVPVMKQTENLLKAYIKEHRLNTRDKLDTPLFHNKQGQKLTRQGISYIVAKYADIEELDKVTPHIYRHTKAMHMTQADINQVYIRDFLGHVDLKTTEVYSKSNTEMKRRALEKLQNNVVPSSTSNWTADGDLMAFLNGLG